MQKMFDSAPLLVYTFIILKKGQRRLCGPLRKREMIQCPNCGQSLPDEAKFCTGCGAPMGQAAPAGNASYNSSSNNIPGTEFSDAPVHPDASPYTGASSYGYGGYTPRVSTKKEFLKLPGNEKIRKEIQSCGIICYVCAAITAIVGLALWGQPLILLDVALLVGLGLGIHLAQSRACAVVLLIYAVYSMIVGLVQNGQLSSWLIAIAGVFAVIYTFKAEKLWKQYQQGGM